MTGGHPSQSHRGFRSQCKARAYMALASIIHKQFSNPYILGGSNDAKSGPTLHINCFAEFQKNLKSKFVSANLVVYPACPLKPQRYLCPGPCFSDPFLAASSSGRIDVSIW
jgi:hypothetical protein